MKKQNRLRKNHEFQKIIQKKKSVINKYLVIYFLSNDRGHSRIGISISKKFINAVGRNRLRRQVRSILTDINDFSKSIDVVIILRKPFMGASFDKKTQAMKEMLKRI